MRVDTLLAEIIYHATILLVNPFGREYYYKVLLFAVIHITVNSKSFYHATRNYTIMIMLQLNDIKKVMHLLLSDTETAFDAFLLQKAEIVSYSTLTIDGHLNKEFYTTEELKELSDEATLQGRIFSDRMIRWSLAKSQCYEFIKGKKAPLSFQITFYLAAENIRKFLSGIDTALTEADIQGLSLILRYDGKLNCIANASLATFTPDKSIQNAWENMVCRFFDKLEVSYEQLS